MSDQNMTPGRWRNLRRSILRAVDELAPRINDPSFIDQLLEAGDGADDVVAALHAVANAHERLHAEVERFKELTGNLPEPEQRVVADWRCRRCGVSFLRLAVAVADPSSWTIIHSSPVQLAGDRYAGTCPKCGRELAVDEAAMAEEVRRSSLRLWASRTIRL